MNDPNNVLNVNSLKVTAQGLPCTTIAGSTISSYTCTLTSNSHNNTPKLVAENFLPAVYMNQRGFAGIASGVNPLLIPLVATSLSVTTGGKNGGYINTLTGKGFP